ncbi:unnamed protein product [Durusdinium trenchii]|uniref:Uncharacterized protein n=1 Tax=Durusdinium trenchii TaxID=1381693 RepID=A0ABP0SIT1_9DINO
MQTPVILSNNCSTLFTLPDAMQIHFFIASHKKVLVGGNGKETLSLPLCQSKTAKRCTMTRLRSEHCLSKRWEMVGVAGPFRRSLNMGANFPFAQTRGISMALSIV